jgi:hypothetical protein
MVSGRIIAVCSKYYPEHKNALCGENIILLNAKTLVRCVTYIQKLCYVYASGRI